MLLPEDVEDDLIEEYPQYYFRKNGMFFYRNGVDNPHYAVDIHVTYYGKEG